MRLLSRYVVREHVGPLLFALAALTSLLMLQYVARQLANLAGKGLPWRAIAEFFVLSLPFTIAMTLPMAVLVATLYAFGRMAAEHEITAFKASGVRVRSLMMPVLFCAFLLSLVMVWFNDQVLPAANHRLRNLQQAIARTRPTLALREQVMNQVTETFFMRVARSDANTNRMWDVVIYDLSKGPQRKTIYADSGVFLNTESGDLQVQLYDGHVQEFVSGDSKQLQRTYFRTQTLRQRGLGKGFEESSSDNFRGDREMSVCEMQRKYVTSAVEYERIRQEVITYQNAAPAPNGKRPSTPRTRPRRVALADFYCLTLPGLVGVKTAKAQAAQPPAAQPPAGQPPAPKPVAKPATGQPAATPNPDPRILEAAIRQREAAAAATAAQQGTGQPGSPPPVTNVAQPIQPGVNTAPAVVPQVPPVNVPPANVPPAIAPSAGDFANVAIGAGAQLAEARESLDSLNVEIQKKFALSFACLVFVLFGPPIALRFPRGGVGVTLGVSILVFGLYYICLMGGEALADKGRLEPAIAMWIANVVFAVLGIAMMWRVESTTDTSRGGGIRDWWADRKAARRLAAADRRAVAASSSTPANA